jgi:hypothetical protein
MTKRPIADVHEATIQTHSSRLVTQQNASYNSRIMTTAVREILAQIDRLDNAGLEELNAALSLRSRARWERLAEVERARSAADGITEVDIDRAVQEVREAVEESPSTAAGRRLPATMDPEAVRAIVADLEEPWRPLDVDIDPELGQAIAEAPEFNIEES